MTIAIYLAHLNPLTTAHVEIINDLLNNQAKLQKIKHENRVKSKQFSIENNLSETLKIINEVIN